MINCVIIDDEPLARENIANYIENVSFLNLVGQGSNPLELNDILNTNQVDLIFLDIQMPVINGIDFLKITPNLPMVILTTAYPSYALEGFDLDVLDYLLKPITFNRFLKAVGKANDMMQLQHSNDKQFDSDDENSHFFIKCDHKYEKIYIDDILFVQALQNYVTICTEERKYVSLLPLKNVEQNLSDRSFMRVHKSYIVNIKKVNNLESHELTIGTHAIPISRNYRKEVKDRILGDSLWRNNPGNAE